MTWWLDFQSYRKCDTRIESVAMLNEILLCLAFPPKQIPFALALWANRLGMLEAAVGQLSLVPSSLKASLLLRHWGNLHWYNFPESEVTGINFCCARMWVLRSAWLWAIGNILLGMRRDEYLLLLYGRSSWIKTPVNLHWRFSKGSIYPCAECLYLICLTLGVVYFSTKM